MAHVFAERIYGTTGSVAKYHFSRNFIISVKIVSKFLGISYR